MDQVPLPAWVVGLPLEAMPDPAEVPPLEPGKRMAFENRWRALTMARLYQRCGWTQSRIGAHVGLTDGRVGQLIRLASRPATGSPR
jgi:hypothetical protein